MELEIIEQSLRKAVSSHRQLLPISSRDLTLEKLDTKNTIVFSRDKGSFNRLCDNWEEFLNSIDKFWNLLNAYKKSYVSPDKSKALTDLLATINSERTQDELLRYLDKARNNAQHTLWRHLIESKPFEVISGSGSTITFLPNGVNVSGPGDSAKEVHIFMKPGVVLLKDVVVIECKKQISYGLPSTHLGYQLKPMERVLPQIIGQKGLFYYQNVFREFQKII